MESVKDATSFLQNSQPEQWNYYRTSVTQIPDLSRVNLRGVRLSYEFDIPENVQTMHLPSFEILLGADLSRANLAGADLSYADLRRVNLSEANLDGAFLLGADLAEARTDGANLRNANLEWARLVRTSVSGAQFSRCHVYGAAVWDLNGKPEIQSDLIITPTISQELLSPKEFQAVAEISVDNLEVAQFLYLLLKNENLRSVIDTVGKKAVLILGRFTPSRKPSLDIVRGELRKRGYLPIVFDFAGPETRDWTETIRILAHLSKFVVADLTDPSSVPKELEAVVPGLAVPVKPIIEEGSNPYAMFRDYWKYPWVLDPLRYNGITSLAQQFDEVVRSAESMVSDLHERRIRASQALD